MIIPKINRIYEYNNEKVIVWGLTLLKTVLYRTMPDKGASEYKKSNWLHFAFNAKYVGKIKFNKYY